MKFSPLEIWSRASEWGSEAAVVEEETPQAVNLQERPLGLISQGLSDG